MCAWRVYALAALLASLFATSSADEECSGHGTNDSTSTKCACDDPTPAPGVTGWASMDRSVKPLGDGGGACSRWQCGASVVSPLCVR